MSGQLNQLFPEVWGGVECTVNRVRDRYVDQLVLTGHDRRLGDLDQIAGLGIRTVRYPILWERSCPKPGTYDWTWSDLRLRRLRDLGIEVIAGLVHHGSGPPWTSLVDESFAPGVADYARRVAERYPWIGRYTIINEPLTTARFSCLYGHWYPHHQSDVSFVRALLNQCHATTQAMQEIRRIRPDAQLVQTEDVSDTSGSPATAAQVEFYRRRRWLSLDLLMGSVNPRHALHQYLLDSGATKSELARLAGQPCPPDVIGLNYYVASDRYLDADTMRYPVERHHRAGGAVFVDVEAVRSSCGISGHQAHIETAWRRYRRPLAITEVHLDCTGEEQMRWLLEAWNAARDARAHGIPVVAITPWALFGSVDWNSLLTQTTGYYEPGAFDIRGNAAGRPRALSQAITDLAHRRDVAHPAAAGLGWWRRSQDTPRCKHANAARPLLITGAGTLGRALARACRERGLEFRSVGHTDVDIADRSMVSRALDDARPWAVINASGYVDVDAAESNVERCLRDNVAGPSVLAEECNRRGIVFATFSSDLVFDGRTREPYLENAAVAPLNIYGQSKATAEHVVLARMKHALIIRTAAFFGPDNDTDFVSNVLREVESGRPFRTTDALVVSPTYVPDLASATIELVLDGSVGTWHLTNGTAISWADFACDVVQRAGLDTGLVVRCSVAELGLRAPRPSFSALGTCRGTLMPSLDSALERYMTRRVSRPVAISA